MCLFCKVKISYVHSCPLPSTTQTHFFHSKLLKTRQRNASNVFFSPVVQRNFNVAEVSAH